MGKMMDGFVCWVGNNLYIRELFTKPVIMNDREMFRNFRVKSARASWHDYGNGIYFVTVCAAHRIHYFGRINNQEMELSAVGQFLSYQLEHISEHYPYAQIPCFVVMPDHFHGVVFIDGDLVPSSKRVECVADNLCTDKSQLARLQGWLSLLAESKAQLLNMPELISPTLLGKPGSMIESFVMRRNGRMYAIILRPTSCIGKNNSQNSTCFCNLWFCGFVL